MRQSNRPLRVEIGESRASVRCGSNWETLSSSRCLPLFPPRTDIDLARRFSTVSPIRCYGISKADWCRFGLILRDDTDHIARTRSDLGTPVARRGNKSALPLGS